MRIVGCLLLIYFAAIARGMQGEMWGIVDLSAVAVVVAVRWCSPGIAAILAFLAGLLSDGVSSGPIGAHAAANVAFAAGLTRWGHAPETWSLGRWTTAILCLVGANTAVMLLSQPGLLISGTDWPRLAVSQAVTALATAVFVGVGVCSARIPFGASCATR